MLLPMCLACSDTNQVAPGKGEQFFTGYEVTSNSCLLPERIVSIDVYEDGLSKPGGAF